MLPDYEVVYQVYLVYRPAAGVPGVLPLRCTAVSDSAVRGVTVNKY